MSLTSKERIMRIFQNKQVDRPAIKLWGAWKYQKGDFLLNPMYEPVAKKASDITDLFIEARSPFNMYCGQLPDITREYVEINNDSWVQRHTVYHTPMGDLRHIEMISKFDEPGYTIEYPVKEPEDLKKILSMKYEPFPYSDNIEYKQQNLNDRGIVMYEIDHIGYALQRLTGSENLAYFSYDCRDLVLEVLDTFAKRQYNQVKRAIDNKVNVPFCWVGPELLTPPLMSENDFEQFCFNYDKPICDMVHNAGSYVWVHCHGKVRKLIERYILMGVDILNPLEPPKNGDVDLNETAKTFKGRIGLEGNIEIQDILLESEEKLKESIHSCVQSGKESGRFILCPSAGFMEYPKPTQKYINNLMTYLDYGYECVNKAVY